MIERTWFTNPEGTDTSIP